MLKDPIQPRRISRDTRYGLLLLWRLAIAFAASIGFIVTAVVGILWYYTPPSVSALAGQFPAANKDLESILAMTKDASAVSRIDPSWLEKDIRRDYKTGDTFVIVGSFGLLNRGVSSGYLHCGRGPEHRYVPCSSPQNSGDHPHCAPGDEAYSFVSLGGGWYAYSEGPS